MDIGNGLKFKIDWEEEGWGIESWVVVDGHPEPSNYIISKASPLGKALVNGNEVFTSPDGQKRFRIVEVKDDSGKNINITDLKKSSVSSPRFVPSTNPVATRIAGLMQDVLGDYFRNKISVPLPKLDDKDIQLSLRWHGAFQSLSKEQLIAEQGENYGLAKMLSARAAENAVIHFFERMLTGEITDVSLSQLEGLVSQSDWKKYDIIADGVAYDVKNSRRTRLNPSNYVEHCVPSYKEYRDQSVKIIGTLSHYLRVRELLDHDAISPFRQTSIRILGCVDQPIITKLTKYFERDTFKLEFQRHLQQGNFLPPWVFDYPTSYYSKRDDGLRHLIKTVDASDWAQTHNSPVPVYLALGLEPPIEWQQKNQYNWQVGFIQLILDAHKEFGLSLPAVFLTVLTHFLDVVTNLNHIPEGYSPSNYRRLIFNTGLSLSPLFLHDPLETVDNLISTLTTLWETKSNRMQDYSSFRLVSARILRGSLASNPNIEHSLVAYCGGRIRDKSPCGKVPLVLGKQSPCEKCGMLICDECGYCSSQCPDNANRQANLNPPQKSVAVQYDDFVDDDDIPF
jgi:hypothetical protein